MILNLFMAATKLAGKIAHNDWAQIGNSKMAMISTKKEEAI